MPDSVSFSIDAPFERVPVAEVLVDELHFSPTRSPDQPATEPDSLSSKVYHRYHIETQTAPDIVPFPSRFRVKVKKHRLIAMVVKELFTCKGNLPVALSRPCVYGVFSRPVGGLAPREELCVGCLRCTVQHPDVVQIYPNPERQRLGDSFVKPEYVDTLLYEARTGRVLVRGAGYRGSFGGEGWDGLWTDMSEIVRPTRDGIHGREFISTVVDIGKKPPFLRFNDRGEAVDTELNAITTQVPFLFDVPANSAQSKSLLPILAEAARQIETLVIVPIQSVVQLSLAGQHVVPMIGPTDWYWLDQLSWAPRMIMQDGWDREL